MLHPSPGFCINFWLGGQYLIRVLPQWWAGSPGFWINFLPGGEVFDLSFAPGVGAHLYFGQNH